MDKQKTMIIAVVVVAVIVIAAAAVALSKGNSSNSSDAAIASQLQIKGNANDDYTIDDKDMAILKDIKAGNKSIKDYPLADIDGDNAITDNDIKLLQDLIDRKTGATVYVICQDRNGDNTTVECTYPIRNAVPIGTNIQESLLYANAGQYVSGYFVSSYKTVEASMSSATDLEGSARDISDAAWKNFMTLDGNLSDGVGALIVDFSDIKRITDTREADLKAAEIPMLVYSPADAESEITTTLTLGFLFGGDCEKMGVDYAQKSWNIIKQVNDKVGKLADKDKASFINCTMYIYICQNDSTFNTSSATAGGIPYYKVNSEFAKTYAGSGSVKMASTEALSNYTDIDAIINNRSMDWGLDADKVKAQIIDCWDHDNKGVSSQEYFKGFEEKLYYINNLLPGAVKVAYMAHAMYGDDFSREWADNVLQDFINLGTNPLKGQTLSSIVSFIDLNDYKKATA